MSAVPTAKWRTRPDTHTLLAEVPKRHPSPVTHRSGEPKMPATKKIMWCIPTILHCSTLGPKLPRQSTCTSGLVNFSGNLNLYGSKKKWTQIITHPLCVKSSKPVKGSIYCSHRHRNGDPKAPTRNELRWFEGSLLSFSSKALATCRLDTGTAELKSLKNLNRSENMFTFDFSFIHPSTQISTW